MADISDVETALVDIIAGLVYPTGSPPSVLGLPIKVYAGWPDGLTLDKDLAKPAAQALHVSIYPQPAARNTTRRDRDDWEEVELNPLTYAAAGNPASGTITISGAAPAVYYPQNFAVIVNGLPYVYQATAAQTAAQVATGLAAAIAVGVPGTAAVGAVVQLPATAVLRASRVGTTGTAIRFVGEEERVFQIILWTDSPDNRTALARRIDPYLRDLPRFELPDGQWARLTYARSEDNDFQQKQGIYRRDLYFSVEFATTITEQQTQIGVITETFEDFNGTEIVTVYD